MNSEEVEEEEQERKRVEKAQLMLKKLKERTRKKSEEKKIMRREMKRVKIKVEKKWIDPLYVRPPVRHVTRPSLYFRDRKVLVTSNIHFELAFWELESFGLIKRLQVNDRPFQARRMVLRKWRKGTFLVGGLEGRIDVLSIETMSKLLIIDTSFRRTIPNFIILKKTHNNLEKRDDNVSMDTIIFFEERDMLRAMLRQKFIIHSTEVSYSSRKKTIKFGNRDRSIDCLKEAVVKYPSFAVSQKFDNCFYITDNIGNYRNLTSPVLVNYKTDLICKKFVHPDFSTSVHLHSHLNSEKNEILFSFGYKFIYIFESSITSSSSSFCECLKKVNVSQRSQMKTVLDTSIIFNDKILIVLRHDRNEQSEEEQSMSFFKITSNCRSLEYIWETNNVSRTDGKGYGHLTFLSYEDKNNAFRLIASGVKSMIRIIRVSGIGRQYLDLKEFHELDLEERVEYLKETYLTGHEEHGSNVGIVRLKIFGSIRCVITLKVLLCERLWL